MSDEEISEADATAVAEPASVGAQLRAAREKKGLTLDQVAADTRISRRHLEHIEAGEWDELASRTYATGFARTYAKSVGLHEGDVVEMVRAEMNVARPDRDHSKRQTFEPGDPSRAPGSKLVWFSLFAVVLLLVGIFFAARVLFSPAAELPTLTEQEEAQRQKELAAQQARQAEEGEPEAAADALDPNGEVVFTAEGETWVRFYDASGRVLSEMTMAEGDTYTVPANANNPMIVTGRPDLLAISIDGESVSKLSTELETIQDVPVSARALLARGAVPAGNRGFGRGSRDAGGATQPSGASEQGATTRSTSAPSQARTQTAARPRTAPAPAPAPAPRPTATRAPRPAATQAPQPAQTTPAPVQTVSEPVVQPLPEG